MPYTSPRFTAQMTTKFKDRSGEFSGARIYVPEDTVFEDATRNGTPDDGLIVNWNTSLATITDGAITGYQLTQTLRGLGASGDGSGNREQKYLFTYHDIQTGEIFDFEIPTRDAAILHPVNTDYYDLTVAPWPTVKTNFEALAVSKLGNAVVLDKVRLTGKNN